MTKHTAAQPLDLDRLQRYDHRGALMVHDETGDYFLVPDVRALAQARADRPTDDVMAAAWAVVRDAIDSRRAEVHPCDRENNDLAVRACSSEIQALHAALKGAARLDTTASASGSIEDYAQFHTLLGSWMSLRDYYQYDGAPQVAEAWRKFIDYIDSRAAHPVQAGEAVDEKLRKSVRSIVQLVRNGEWADLLDMDDDACALWDVVDGLLRRATLAPVAAQQAAAKAPAAQAVPADISQAMDMIKAFREGKCSFPSGEFDRVARFIDGLATPASTPEASQQAAAVVQSEACGTCNGTGWVARDPDIGTDQECFVCDGAGKVAAATTSDDAPSEKQTKLRALADRIDHEKLWKRPMMDRLDGILTPEQCDRLDAGVMLRRYADLLAPGRWLVVPPTGNVKFGAGSLEKVTEMAKQHQERKSMRATQQEGE